MKNIFIILFTFLSAFGVAQSNTVVISEVYGGGGDINATYKNDYIQLFNLSSTPVALDQYSIQVAQAGDKDWKVINLTGILQPSHWYLLKGESDGASGKELPLADATVSFDLNTQSGKIALVKSEKALTTSCLPFNEIVVDLLGYGITDCAETSTAPAHNSISATSRFIFTSDADNNASDFAVFPPNPRN
ncbi:MAG: lamin tail domain-containing protein [Ginsengibacter sp.]